MEQAGGRPLCWRCQHAGSVCILSKPAHSPSRPMGLTFGVLSPTGLTFGVLNLAAEANLLGEHLKVFPHVKHC